MKLLKSKLIRASPSIPDALRGKRKSTKMKINYINIDQMSISESIFGQGYHLLFINVKYIFAQFQLS